MLTDNLHAAAAAGRHGEGPSQSRWEGIAWWMVAALGVTARVAAEEPVAAPSAADVAARCATEQLPPREKRILLFSASWCGPCQEMKGDLQKPERTPNATCARLQKAGWKIGVEPSNHVQVVDMDASPELSEKYSIQSLPTLILIENGRELRRLEGCVDEWTVSKLYKGYDERLSRNDIKTGSDAAGS